MELTFHALNCAGRPSFFKIREIFLSRLLVMDQTMLVTTAALFILCNIAVIRVRVYPAKYTL